MAFNFETFYKNQYKKAYEEANTAYEKILKVNNDLNESKLTYVNTPTLKEITKKSLEFYQQASNTKDTYESSQLKYGIDSLVANTLNVPISLVAKNRNIYWKNLFNTEDEKTIFEAIGDSYRSYYVMQEISNLNNKLFNSKDELEIESLEEQISDLEQDYARLSDPTKPYRSMPINSIIESSAQVPNTIHSAMVTAGGTAALVALGSAFSVAVPISAALFGGTVMSKIYTLFHTANSEKGSMINDLRKATDINGKKINLHDTKVEQDINVSAYLKGAIEVFADLGFDFMVNKGIISPLKNATKNTVNKLFKTTFSKYLKSAGVFAGATILDALSESSTEGLENVTSNYYTNEILRHTNNTIGSDFEVIDNYEFENFVKDFSQAFVQSFPVSLTLGVFGAGSGKLINYASYKYDKVKNQRASNIYGIDFEAQKKNNEFSTVENNAFSDEKYKMVNKDAFNINPSKMSSDAKKIYNEMVIVKDNEEGNTEIANEKFKEMFSENKHSSERPEGYNEYTIKDKKTGDSINVFIKSELNVPKVELDQNNRMVKFKDAESESTVVVQNIIDMANGISTVPIETFKISPTFENENQNYVKSFNDVQQLQSYLDHYIDQNNNTIEFKTKAGAEEFLKNVKDNKIAVKGSNYISDVTKTGTVSFKIGDEIVEYKVSYLDNKLSNNLAQKYYSLPKKLREHAETTGMLKNGYIEREILEESYAQDYIKKSIENKIELNKTNNTQKIGKKRLSNIIEAGASSLYAIYRKTGLSPESFMDLLDFKIADNGELKDLNGLLTTARSTLNQINNYKKELDSYLYIHKKNNSVIKPNGYLVKFSKDDQGNITIKTSDNKYEFNQDPEEDSPIIIKFDDLIDKEAPGLKNELIKLFTNEDSEYFLEEKNIENIKSLNTFEDLIKLLNSDEEFNNGEVNIGEALNTLFKDLSIADVFITNNDGDAIVINDELFNINKLEEQNKEKHKQNENNVNIKYTSEIIESKVEETKTSENIEEQNTDNFDNIDSVSKINNVNSVNKSEKIAKTEEKDGFKNGKYVDNYKYTITITKKANVSTLVHEAGHVLRDLLTPDELEKVSKVYNVDIDDWYSGSDIEQKTNGMFSFNNKEYKTKQEALRAKDKTVRAEEQFANDFTMYLATATSPIQALNIVFNKIKNILTGIAETLIKNGTFREGYLNASIENLFADLLMTKDDIIHRELLQKNINVNENINLNENEDEESNEAKNKEELNFDDTNGINAYYKNMNITDGGLEDKKITKKDIKTFVSNGFYVPIKVLEKILATNKKDFILNIGDEKIFASKYLQLKHELENGDSNLYQVAYEKGLDIAISLIPNTDENKDIKSKILEKETKSSIRPTQYVGKIVYRLLNDDNYLVKMCKKITDYFVPIYNEKTKLIELRKYDAVENIPILYAKKLSTSFGDERKSIMNLIRTNIKDNAGIWAREVFRAETLYDIFQSSEDNQWYYDGFLTDEQKYFNFLLKFGSDEGFESISNDINYSDLTNEQIENITNKLSELDDELGYFDSDLDNILNLDRSNKDDIKDWNAKVINNMNIKYDVLRRTSILNLKQLFNEINKDSFKTSFDQINSLLKELQTELRKNKLNSDENIKLDEELDRVFEYLNSDVTNYDSFVESIKNLIDDNFGFQLNEDIKLDDESLIKIKKLQEDLNKNLERMMFIHFENEQAINSLMKNLSDKSSNKDLKNTIKAHEKNLSTMYKSIEKAIAKINKQQEFIDDLIAKNNLLKKKLGAASSRLRTEYTRRFKNQITKITKLSGSYDCSIEPLMSYINYLIGNKVVVKDKNQETSQKIFSDYQELINDDAQKYDDALDNMYNNIINNENIGDIYESVAYSPEGINIENFRTRVYGFDEKPRFYQENGLSENQSVIDDMVIERGKQLVAQFPKQLYDELINTLPYNINVNYAVERMIYHKFSEWGVDIQKALYKAVQNIKTQAKEQRQEAIKQRNSKALNIAKDMIASLSKDLEITNDDIKSYITNYLYEAGMTSDINELSDYEILDLYYDFDNNRQIKYADLLTKYPNKNAFEIISEDEDFRYRMLKDIISKDSRNKLVFRNKSLNKFQEFIKNASDNFRIWMSQPSLIFNYLSELSGNLTEDEYSGAFEKFFIRDLLKSDNQEQLNIANRMKESSNKFSEIFGIKFENRSKIYESTDNVYIGNGKFVSLEESGLNPIKTTFINNFDNKFSKEESLLTRQQIIGLYIYSKNLYTDKMSFKQREFNQNTVYSHSARNLMDIKGNNFGEEFIVDLHNNPTSYLSDQEIKWADYMIEQVGSKKIETFNLMKDIYNINMTLEENYFPMVNSEYVNIISSKTGVTNVKPNANHTVERTQAVYPIDLNVCDTFERSIKQQEHLLAFAEWADMFNRIWKYQGNIEKTLNKVVGNELTEYIFDYSKLATNRQYFRSNNEMSFMNKVLANQSITKVVGSLITLVRQYGSVLNAQLNIGISLKEIASAFNLINKKIEGTDITWAEWIDSVDAEMLNRKLDPVTEQALSRNKQSFIKDLPYINKLHPDELIKLVQKTDKYFAQAVWIACFRKFSKGKLNFDSDITKNDTLYKTIMSVRKTQSGSSIVENTKLQNSAKYGNNYIAKLIVQFQNDILKLQSEMIYGFGREKRHGNRIRAGIKLLAIPLSMAIFNVLLNGDWIPEEDDDEVIDINSALKDLGNEFINNTLPVAGKYVANTLRGYGSTTFIPFADSISNLISTVAKLYNPPRGRDRSDVVLSGLYNIGLDVSSSIGVPSELIRRIVKMFINTKDWEFSFNPLYFINTNAGNWLEDKIH